MREVGRIGKVAVRGIVIVRSDGSSICTETKIAWDADAFLDKYDIPKAA
jgi:hypothetical protein